MDCSSRGVIEAVNLKGGGRFFRSTVPEWLKWQVGHNIPTVTHPKVAARAMDGVNDTRM